MVLFSERVKQLTTITGTGAYSIAGTSSFNGFMSFGESFADGDIIGYCVVMGADFEVGLGTLGGGGTTLSRTTVLSSTNSGQAVDWAAGNKEIFCDVPAAFFPTFSAVDPSSGGVFIGKEHINVVSGQRFIWDGSGWVGNQRAIIEPPVVTAPTGTDVQVNAVLALAAYAGGVNFTGSHTATDWELASDENFSTIVFSSYADASNLVSITPTGASSGTTYYARARFIAGDFRSNWGRGYTFTTAEAIDFQGNEIGALWPFLSQSGAQVGKRVAISGDGLTAVASAPYRDSNKGALFVWINDGAGNWSEPVVTPITAVDGSTEHKLGEFGLAINHDGTRIAASAKGSTGGDGAVYVFDRVGDTFSQSDKLVTAEYSGAQLGDAVSMSDDGKTLAATSYMAAGMDGICAIWTESSGTWTRDLTWVCPEADTYAGVAVSVSGDGLIVAVGVPYGNGGASASGVVYVLSKRGGTWLQEDVLNSAISGADSHFGSAVSCNSDGEFILVGNPGYDGSRGRAHIFKTVAGAFMAWAEETYVEMTARAAGDMFGESVAISRNGAYIAVGCEFDDVGTTDSGSVAVYESSDLSNWSIVLAIQSSANTANGNFGCDVSITANGKYVAAGASDQYGGASTGGRLYIFD